jgi:hypothetical protein
MRKMRKFAKGGSADRAQSRYDRMTKDIESDYEKAKGRKSGRALEVAKAKYEQRMADARDDRAKARGEDRTATRAAEKAAERNLSTTRRYGASKTAAAVGASEPIAKPMSTSQISEAVASKPAATSTSGGSFSEAFRAARKGGDKTFTWRGKSYSTRMAGEGASRPGTTRRAAAPRARAPEMKDTREIVVEGRRKPSNLEDIRRKGAALRASFTGPPSGPRKTDREMRLEKIKTAAEAPGANRLARDRYKYALQSGMYAKGGKIDGAAVRGMTRAKRK